MKWILLVGLIGLSGCGASAAPPSVSAPVVAKIPGTILLNLKDETPPEIIISKYEQGDLQAIFGDTIELVSVEQHKAEFLPTATFHVRVAPGGAEQFIALLRLEPVVKDLYWHFSKDIKAP